MTLQHRIDLLARLGNYIQDNGESWKMAKENANRNNPWFIPAFIDKASQNITQKFLVKEDLENWIAPYSFKNTPPKLVGLVMAGNLPMVGFHDMISIFISGHRQAIKLSSKDEILIPHLVGKLIEWEPAVGEFICFKDKLKNCDAYVATGSNNSSRYFEYYFGKYPNIIRRNRTSVALLNGSETPGELTALADDIHLYFGLGCRNITKLYVPEAYDFIPLLKALEKYDWVMEFHKYRHNYDYQLALLMMGNKKYMTNESVILHENTSLFTPVSQVHFEYYTNKNKLLEELKGNPDVQCIAGSDEVPFGQTQEPELNNYADGINTLEFLKTLSVLT